jgi:hypothetical protein
VTAYDKSGNESTYSQEVHAPTPSIAKPEAENNGGGSCFMSQLLQLLIFGMQLFYPSLCSIQNHSCFGKKFIGKDYVGGKTKAELLITLSFILIKP